MEIKIVSQNVSVMQIKDNFKILNNNIQLKVKDRQYILSRY